MRIRSRKSAGTAAATLLLLQLLLVWSTAAAAVAATEASPALAGADVHAAAEAEKSPGFAEHQTSLLFGQQQQLLLLQQQQQQRSRLPQLLLSKAVVAFSATAVLFLVLLCSQLYKSAAAAAAAGQSVRSLAEQGSGCGGQQEGNGDESAAVAAQKPTETSAAETDDATVSGEDGRATAQKDSDPSAADKDDLSDQKQRERTVGRTGDLPLETGESAEEAEQRSRDLNLLVDQLVDLWKQRDDRPALWSEVQRLHVIQNLYLYELQNAEDVEKVLNHVDDLWRQQQTLWTEKRKLLQMENWHEGSGSDPSIDENRVKEILLDQLQYIDRKDMQILRLKGEQLVKQQADVQLKLQVLWTEMCVRQQCWPAGESASAWESSGNEDVKRSLSAAYLQEQLPTLMNEMLQRQKQDLQTFDFQRRQQEEWWSKYQELQERLEGKPLIPEQKKQVKSLATSIRNIKKQYDETLKESEDVKAKLENLGANHDAYLERIRNAKPKDKEWMHLMQTYWQQWQDLSSLLGTQQQQLLQLGSLGDKLEALAGEKPEESQLRGTLPRTGATLLEEAKGLGDRFDSSDSSYSDTSSLFDLEAKSPMAEGQLEQSAAEQRPPQGADRASRAIPTQPLPQDDAACRRRLINLWREQKERWKLQKIVWANVEAWSSDETLPEQTKKKISDLWQKENTLWRKQKQGWWELVREGETLENNADEELEENLLGQLEGNLNGQTYTELLQILEHQRHLNTQHNELALEQSLLLEPLRVREKETLVGQLLKLWKKRRQSQGLWISVQHLQTQQRKHASELLQDDQAQLRGILAEIDSLWIDQRSLWKKMRQLLKMDEWPDKSGSDPHIDASRVELILRERFDDVQGSNAVTALLSIKDLMQEQDDIELGREALWTLMCLQQQSWPRGTGSSEWANSGYEEVTRSLDGSQMPQTLATLLTELHARQRRDAKTFQQRNLNEDHWWSEEQRLEEQWELKERTRQQKREKDSLEQSTEQLKKQYYNLQADWYLVHQKLRTVWESHYGNLKKIRRSDSPETRLEARHLLHLYMRTWRQLAVLLRRQDEQLMRYDDMSGKLEMPTGSEASDRLSSTLPRNTATIERTESTRQSAEELKQELKTILKEQTKLWKEMDKLPEQMRKQVKKLVLTARRGEAAAWQDGSEDLKAQEQLLDNLKRNQKEMWLSSVEHKKRRLPTSFESQVLSLLRQMTTEELQNLHKNQTLLLGEQRKLFDEQQDLQKKLQDVLSKLPSGRH